MTTALLYFVITFTGPDWHGSRVVLTTPSQARCEAIAAHIAARGKLRAECHTMVMPK